MAYERLRKAIISGELSPGMPLTELQLAAQLNLSRTPVREALVNLSREGLVELVPGRGAVVARLSLEDAIEIYQIREALEGMAARLGGARVPEAEIDRLERAYADLEAAIASGQWDPDEERALGQELHDAIIKAAGNQRIAVIIEQMRGQNQLAGIVARNLHGRNSPSVRSHREILAAVRNRDASAVEMAVRRHLASLAAEIVRAALPTETREEPEPLVAEDTAPASGSGHREDKPRAGSVISPRPTR